MAERDPVNYAAIVAHIGRATPRREKAPSARPRSTRCAFWRSAARN